MHTHYEPVDNSPLAIRWLALSGLLLVLVALAWFAMTPEVAETASALAG